LFANVEAQVSRDLLVATASAMQLVARIADEFDQPALDEVVDVFHFVVFEERGISGGSGDLFEGATDGREFVPGEHLRRDQRFRVGATRFELFGEQTAVEWERALPALEVGVERLAESP